MSNYLSKALNPVTHKIEQVHMWDNWFGQHEYGVRFSDGNVYPENQVVCICDSRTPDDLDAEDVRVFYQNNSSIIFSVESGFLYGDTFNSLSDACVAFKNTVDGLRNNQ